MKDLVKAIVVSLVDHPEQVAVEEMNTNHLTILQLRVANDDIGKVIGKKGRNAEAIRTILQAVSAKLKRSAFLEIVE
jgi:predicted RNA-binding protein YlqC (UPF0109 family)